jgi:hypothetical protein
MPSKSKAQFGMMGRLYSEGKITRKQLHDFNHGVHPKDLPAHVKGKGKAKGSTHRAMRRALGAKK